MLFSFGIFVRNLSKFVLFSINESLRINDVNVRWKYSVGFVDHEFWPMEIIHCAYFFYSYSRIILSCINYFFLMGSIRLQRQKVCSINCVWNTLSLHSLLSILSFRVKIESISNFSQSDSWKFHFSPRLKLVLFSFIYQRLGGTGFTYTRVYNAHLKLNDNTPYWVLTHTSKITRARKCHDTKVMHVGTMSWMHLISI